MVIYVCQDCHGKDEKLTGCGIGFFYHLSKRRAQCDICGGWGMLVQCRSYTTYIMQNSFRHGKA